MLWRLTDCEWLTQVNQYVLSPSDLIDLLPSRCPFIRRYSDIIMQLLHSSIFIPLWTDWSRNDIWDTFIQFEIYFRSDWNISSAFIDRRPRIKILFQIIFSQTLKYFSGRTCNGIKSKGLSKKTNSDLKTRESENVILDLSIWLELKTAFISSVRSSYSHPDLLVITTTITTTTPLFQITPVLNTGLSLTEPLQLYKGYNAI